ncbi:golgi-body localization protein domain-containing protein [Gaertneriomyces semiglobifer]|nr:golgi-body localization protein domain-containing protein [Gaertneriomyces semiglobifer]
MTGRIMGVIVALAIILIAYISVRVCWNLLLRALGKRYGLRAEHFGLTSISHLTYCPAAQGNANSSKGNIVFVEAKVGLLWINLHRPGAGQSSWISVRILGPKLKVRAAVGGRKKGSTSRLKLSERLQIRRILDSASRVLRHGFISMLFRMVDIKIDDLDLIVLNEDGVEVLQYQQPSVELSLDPDAGGQLSAASRTYAASNAQAHFRAKLVVSPFSIISLREGDPERLRPPILIVDSSSVIVFEGLRSMEEAKHARERPHAIMTVSGISLSASELSHAIRMLRRKSIDSSTQDPQISAATALDLETAHEWGKKVITAFRGKMSELRELKPAITVICNRLSITADSCSSGCDGIKDRSLEIIPSLLATVESVRASLRVSQTAAPNYSLFNMQFEMNEAFVDLFNAEGTASTTQVFSLKSATCGLEVPLVRNRTGHGGRRTSVEHLCRTDIAMKIVVDTPTILLTDHLILLMLACSRSKHPSPVLPNQAQDSKDDSFLQRALLLISFGLFSPSVDIRIIRPTGAVEFTRYPSSSKGSHSGPPCFSLCGDALNFSGKLVPGLLEGGHRSSDEMNSLDFEFNADVRPIKVVVSRGNLPSADSRSMAMADQLLHLADTTLSAHVVTGNGPNNMSPMHVNMNSKVGELSIDLSRLTCCETLDYFKLVASITSSWMILPKTETRAAASDTISIPMIFYFQSTFQPIRIFAVGEDRHSALAAEIKKVLVQISRRNDSHEWSASTRSEASEITLTTCGDYDVTEGNMFQTDALHQHCTDLALVIPRMEFYTVSSPNHDLRTPPTIQIGDANIRFGLRIFYVGLMSMLYCIKLARLTRSAAKHNVVESRPSGGSQGFLLLVDTINVDLELPEEVKVRLLVSAVNMSKDVDSAFRLRFDKALVDILVDAKHKRLEPLVTSGGLELFVRKSVAGQSEAATHVDCNFENLVLTVPSRFKVADVIENAINLQKAIKLLISTHLGLRRTSTCSPIGQTHIDSHRAPVILLNVGMVVIKVMDDPFESALSRNYLLGLDEQAGRLAREKAFQRKAATLRPGGSARMSSPVAGGAVEVESAWWMLQEFNARSWVEQIAAATRNQRWYPPLMTAVCEGLKLRVAGPTLPADTVEASLHLMDPQTPKGAIYDDLIPRDIVLQMRELSIRVRDYPAPLLHIPPAGDNTWNTRGLFILVEQLSGTESKRVVELPLHPLEADGIRVTRTVNPTKMYTSLVTTISTSSSIQLSWGAGTEPGISDMMAALDTLTRPNVDPSQPIGWWDKLRVIFHGHNIVRVTGGGDVQFRMLGSITPYFNPRREWGTEGLAIEFRNGVTVDINGNTHVGEDVVIESGEMALYLPGTSTLTDTHTSQKDADELIARLSGGVKIGLGFKFLTERSDVKRRSHADLILRAPEYCHFDDTKEEWDSFRGFRTKHMRVAINIESPRPFYTGLVEPLNFLGVSLQALERLFNLVQIYQSVLTSLPVRRGALFQEAGPPVSKQKLGRVVSSIRLISCMHNLALGFTTDLEEAQGGVGLRCRARRMDVDITLVQRLLRRRPTEDLLTRKSAVKWNLNSSEIEFTDIEAKAVSWGQATPWDQHTNPSSETSSFSDAEDDSEWMFIHDEQRAHLEDYRIIPFAWAPKIIYHKRNDSASPSSQEAKRSPKGIYEVQLAIFNRRLQTIESSIRHYLELQHGLEYRMAVFFDDSLRQQSQIIVEKMTILHEKKVTIERHMRNCLRKIETEETGTIPNVTHTDAKLPKIGMFKHHYIVHNVNFLWKRDVRNIIFQMISLQQKSSAIRYCLSHTATRVMTQLAARMATKPSESSATVTTPQSDSSKLPHSSTPAATTKRMAMAVVEMTPKMAHKLLSKLVDEMGTSFVVPNETDMNQEHITMTSGNSGAGVMLNNHQSYIPSRDPESPDYVADGQTYECYYTVQFINPQVNLEAEPKSDSSQLETLVVAAESMQLRSVWILDEQAHASQSAEELGDRNEDVIKSRMILTIQNAQIFVARRADIELAGDTDMDNIAIVREEPHTNPSMTPWPVWVPVECLVDYSSHSGYLQRIVERTSASVHRDAPNPLYLKSNNAANSPELTQTLHVNFPSFSISANASQYVVIHDVIENLLIYRDPARGEHTERLKKMLLVLEQTEDLRKVQEIVLSLQAKIRQAEALMRWGVSSPEELAGEGVLEARNYELQRHIVQYQDELIVIVHALKVMQNLEEKRKSAAIAWQTQISVGTIAWRMLLDDNSPLCQWTLNTAQFNWVQNEDQSNINTLQIDQIHVESQLSAPNSFKEVLAPYIPDKRDVDFTRHKMLRVYWRELPPVAGIKVVDHFEINIFPLLIQVTYEMGKQIVYYLFPEKKAKAAEKALNTDARKLPRSESSDQITVRSVRTNASEPAGMRSLGSADDLGRYSSADEAEVTPVPEKKRLFKFGTHSRQGSGREEPVRTTGIGKVNEIKQMQARASENRSFIYIKVPGGQHCLSYRGSKEKNIEDLFMFAFKMPTLEFRNKTWTWLDFLESVKKEAFRAVLANTGALVREKLFQSKRKQAATASASDVDTPTMTHRKSIRTQPGSFSMFKGKKDIRMKSAPSTELLFDADAEGFDIPELDDSLE